jgi:WD40 repeat protein
VTAVAFLPDGMQLVSTSPIETALWDIASGRKVATMQDSFNQSAGRVFGISGDGKRVAVAFGMYMQVWEVATGKKIASFPVSSPDPQMGASNVHCVALSSDGRLALAGRYEPLILFDVHQGKAIQVLRSHKDVLSVSFSPDDRFAISRADNTRDVIEGKTGKVKKRTGKSVVEFWRLGDGALLKTFSDAHGGRVGFSPDGKYGYSCGRTFRKWELEGGKLVDSSQELDGELEHRWFSYSPDKRLCVEHLIPSYQEKWDKKIERFLTLREVSTGRAVRTWEQMGKTRHGFWGLYCTAFSADGSKIAVGGAAGFLQVLDVKTGKVIREFPSY